MSISSTMRTSASGMAAQSNRLSTVADNIANANTSGYKRAYCEFSSFIPNRSTAEYTSGSVTTALRNAISEQGTFSYTTSTTDLAVSGQGFFLVANTDGTAHLTRAGSFVKDGDGYLVNAAGYYLMGYPVTDGDVGSVVNGTTGLEKIAISDLALQAELSTEGIFYVNVDASAQNITDISATAVPPSTNTANSAYTSKSSIVVYGDLGYEITLDVYWAKTASETWELAIFNRADAPATGTFPYSAAALASDTMTFDPITGENQGPTSITIDLSGTTPSGSSALTLDLSQCTQLNTDYTVRTGSVNGNAPSDVDRIEVANDGLLYAIFENGSRIASYQVPLATVPSPDNLLPLQGDVFVPDNDSGNMLIGFPGLGGVGTILDSALEQSTVDLASELANMIEAERHYQMNSKVFQTGADILDVIVNLKR